MGEGSDLDQLRARRRARDTHEEERHRHLASRSRRPYGKVPGLRRRTRIQAPWSRYAFPGVVKETRTPLEWGHDLSRLRPPGIPETPGACPGPSRRDASLLPVPLVLLRIPRPEPPSPTPEEEKARYLLHRNDPDGPGYRSYLEDFIRKAVSPFAPPGSGGILDFGSGPVYPP
ncbi:MAG: hypothetical protein M0C28_48450 [Candidatus Moduliflexus flocculans]|nr:hypothetical protein [Candidatus Moduliflexus flocculans]